jgi:hypothetical protein
MGGGTKSEDAAGWEGAVNIGIVDVGVPRDATDAAASGFWRGIGVGFGSAEFGNPGEANGEGWGRSEAE